MLRMITFTVSNHKTANKLNYERMREAETSRSNTGRKVDYRKK